MKSTHVIKLLAASPGLLVVGLLTQTAPAADITKDSTGSELTAGASWVGGIAPGSGDTAVFDSTSLGGTFTLDSTVTSSPDLGSVRILNPGSDIVIDLIDTWDLTTGLLGPSVIAFDMSSATR